MASYKLFACGMFKNTELWTQQILMCNRIMEFVNHWPLSFDSVCSCTLLLTSLLHLQDENEENTFLKIVGNHLQAHMTYKPEDQK